MQFTKFDAADYIEDEYQAQFFLGLAYASFDKEHIKRAEAADARARLRWQQEQKAS